MLVAALLAIGGVLLALILWGGSSGQEVSPDEAARRLPTGAASGAVTSEPTRSDQSGSDPNDTGLAVPAQGVYLYRGSGTDALSSPPKEQTEGPDMPATVTHTTDRCWTFRIDYHSNHWQSWDYCIDGDRLLERGGSTFQRWDFGVFVNESTSTFACASVVTVDLAAEPEDEWTQSCDSADAAAPSTSAGPYRFVGSEELEVDGVTIPALRYHRERTMSGTQVGTESADVWFRRSDGLPLRNRRNIEVRTETIIGVVTYTEAAEFELTSASPTVGTE